MFTNYPVAPSRLAGNGSVFVVGTNVFANVLANVCAVIGVGNVVGAGVGNSVALPACRRAVQLRPAAAALTGRKRPTAARTYSLLGS